MKLKLEEMSLEQKLGFVFCSRKFATVNDDDMAFTLEMIKKRALGCVQLPAGRADLMEAVRSAADYPILIFCDTERGYPTYKIPPISLMSLSACDRDEYFKAFAEAIAAQATEAGFNGTWGPVIDVLRCDGPCRVYRHFSDDPDTVARMAEIMATVYRDSGYLSTGKHYPGGGDYDYDTHMAEGISQLDEKELVEFDLVPYIKLMEKGLLPCIMTAHTVFEKIDPERPASLSKKVIGIIRDLGFDGLCFTDSFAMMGILQKYGEENVYGMAIDAGNDIVLPNFRHSTRDCFEMLKKNYEDGAFSEERLNDAVRHVLAAQDFVAKAPKKKAELTDDIRNTLKMISKDCISAVTDEGTTAKIGEDSEDRIFIIVTENEFDPTVDNPETDMSVWYHPDRIAKKIKESFPKAHVEFIPEFSGQKDNDRVLTTASFYKKAVFVSFCSTTSYLGTDSLTKRTESVMNCLIRSGKVEAIVHFGNPYALQTIAHVSRRIFGYMTPDAQLYAIDVLKGELEPNGNLPYKIELQ